jgi:hypothetical protein
MDLKLYREEVKRLVAERNGEAIYNGSADHAAVIVENLFIAAKEKVRLLTGDLNARVYGTRGVVERAQQFLGHSDHQLDVLVEEWTVSRSHPLLEGICSNPNVAFYQIPEELSNAIGYHLMTADDDCFRFEREKNSHAAVAAWGDKETTRHLNTVWDSIKDRCTKLDIVELAG